MINMTTSPIIRRHPRANGGHAGKVGKERQAARSAPSIRRRPNSSPRTGLVKWTRRRGLLTVMIKNDGDDEGGYAQRHLSATVVMGSSGVGLIGAGHAAMPCGHAMRPCHAASISYMIRRC